MTVGPTERHNRCKLAAGQAHPQLIDTIELLTADLQKLPFGQKLATKDEDFNKNSRTLRRTSATTPPTADICRAINTRFGSSATTEGDFAGRTAAESVLCLGKAVDDPTVVEYQPRGDPSIDKWT
jgi:hypothetical protein